ncbi:MAG TPA: serine/threonine-protein kinase [Polyangia bacterium]|nr:serine/threonine-protein kinase [Polyangia bacterium]
MKAGAEANRIGEIVGGKYRVVRLLASGGMGVVYEAQHAVVRRRFAIKFLRRDLAERRDILSRFQREAEAAGALENDNVTAAVDFGISDDGTPFIVMEYLVGESLAALIEREGRLPVHRAADLVAQACRGVEAAHAAGIVHRDLKPQNLFVARRDDGTDLVKVLDFGVAKLQALDEATAATGTGTILGTAAYMAPEQARGEKAVDKRADVYALGAILYEVLSQRKPHPGDSPNAILHHIATHPAVPLESVHADLPAALVAIVGRALASDPAARPASAGGLAQELAAFARREVWPPPPETSAPTTAALASTSLAAAENEKPASAGGASTGSTFRDRLVASAPPPSRRVPVGARVALGAAAVVAVAVAVGLKARSTPPAPDARPAAPLPEASRIVAPVPEPAAVPQKAAEKPAPPAPPPTPVVAGSGPPSGHGRPAGRPGGRPAHRAEFAGQPAKGGAETPAPPPPAKSPANLPPTFDPANPYR